MSVHVHPNGDSITHQLDRTFCVCGPHVEWVDPDTGDTYPHGPLVTHHSLDGREHHEPETCHPSGWSVA